MHVLEKAFIDLLRNHITLPNEKIYTGNRYRPTDITPCVNISLVAENLIKQRYIELNTTQYIQKKYDTELWINIYANSEEERQTLIQEIHNRILQAESNHYTTCANFIFQTKLCSKTDETCAALTVQNGRTNKKQCPQKELYQSFFQQHNITKRTFHVDSTTDLDDYQLSETSLRTIIKLSMNYHMFYKIGGKTYNNIKISEDLI